MEEAKVRALCDVVRETSFAIHRYHRSGHLEKIYENALAHRLRKQGIGVEQQHPLTVYDEDGFVLGEFFADLFVEGCLVVELKACSGLANAHTAQVLGYLRASRKRDGMLINFGAAKLQVKKYVLDDAEWAGQDSNCAIAR